jgi:signal transduction histidine kinase
MTAGVVLLLDDRPDDRRLMSTLLSYAGYTVLEADRGERALELARKRRPDLIVSDILMPGMNGYEFVRRLRELPDVGATPVVFCTANYLEQEVHVLAASCGVSKFISKPSPPDLVLSTVADALGQELALPLPPAPGPEFEREQLRVINDKLVEKVAELERVLAHRRHLLGLLMSAQEEERARIASGIHDDSLQSVVAIGLRLAVLRRQLQDPAAVAALRGTQETARVAAERLRSLLFELRPTELESHGLGSALRLYLERARRDEGLEFVLNDRLDTDPDVATRTFLYRVTQEVLMNVRRHAGATAVEVTLAAREGNHVIRVRDDGVGFDPGEALRARPGHLGLAALRERVELAGGAVRIDSAPGAGATVELELPAATQEEAGRPGLVRSSAS